jgi:twitching motility protein PilI
VPLPAVAPVPLTQAWYLGLANVRGNLVGVVDLARYLGLEQGRDAAPAAAGPRLVTFAPGLGFPCALLVERVVGLRQAADMTPAGTAPDAASLRDADGREWIPLSLAGLVREERFLQVALHDEPQAGA